MWGVVGGSKGGGKRSEMAKVVLISPSAVLSRLAQAGKGRLVTSEGWAEVTLEQIPLYGPWMRQSCMWEIPREAQGPSLPPSRQDSQTERCRDAETSSPSAPQRQAKSQQDFKGPSRSRETEMRAGQLELTPDFDQAEIDHRSHPPKSATNIHRASSPSGWDNSLESQGAGSCAWGHRLFPPPEVVGASAHPPAPSKLGRKRWSVSLAIISQGEKISTIEWDYI